MKRTLAIFTTIILSISGTMVLHAQNLTIDTTENNDMNKTLKYAVLTSEFNKAYISDKAVVVEPMDGEVEEVLALLRKSVDVYNDAEKNKGVGEDRLQLINLDEYSIQLVPSVLDGSRVYYANCLCRLHGRDLNEGIIMVRDGGKCYFQVKINVSKKTWYDFSVNGMG